MKAYLGTRKGLLLLEKQGTDWDLTRLHFDGVKVPYVYADPESSKVWAGVNHGHWGIKLHLSEDGGLNFRELGAPKFDEALKDSVKDIWAITSDTKGRLYIGTAPAALFYSDDQGTTWKLVESLYNDPRKKEWMAGGAMETCLHSILVEPNNPDHLYVGISCAGMMESLDRGKNWSYRNKGLNATFLPDPSSEVGQDPHRIVMAKTNSKILWQQNHCGLFRSMDGGNLWEDYSKKKGLKSAFGWGIAVDEENPNMVFTVPSLSDEFRVPVSKGLLVQRSKDGGETWEALGKGLPQTNCFDIIYRHALALKGRTLMFGTTTGNVYTSSNHGDAWSQISAHFPPVYSVEIKA